jgi:hypothetical protein
MTNRRLNLSLLLLVGLLIAAFALRLFRLDTQSIWWDEGISLHLGTSSMAEIVRDRLDNIHPPLYFLILKGWLALVGVSPFTGRYLSALTSLVQVALVFAAGCYWSRWRGDSNHLLPWIAAGLMLISPLSVIYGQEIRVYAMLPVVYLTMLLAAERILDTNGRRITPLFILGLTEWLGLHLHYIALFGVAYVALLGAITLFGRRDRTALRRWLLVQGAVALACLPWFVAVARNLSAVGAEANAGTFTAEAVPLPFLFAQVWAFHLTGLAGSLASRFVQVGAFAAAVLMGILLVARIVATGRRSVSLRLATHWSLPLIAALIVWNVRSFSHPRYIVMFAVMLIPLAAALRYPARRWAERVAALALAICLVGLSFWGLQKYFFDTGAAKPDMRGVARYLESTAGPGDLIIIPDTDWSLPFEYRGAAGLIMPGLDEAPRDGLTSLDRALDCSGDPCAESGRVFVVDYQTGTRDWQGRLPFELERRGHLTGQTEFDDLVVREYRMTGQARPLPGCDTPELARPNAGFGPLRLESVWVEEGAAADTAVAVALCWRLAEATSEEFVASLVLSDPLTGERVAQSDNTLVNPAGAPTDQWTPGDSVVTYHLLPLPQGTPPIGHALAAGVYPRNDDIIELVEVVDAQGQLAGRNLPLGEVSLSPPVGNPTAYDVAAPPLWAEPAEAAEGLQLLGARFSPGPYRPGQTIRVGLTWRATAGNLPDLRPALTLEQGGGVLAENAETPANGRYPTDQWAPGQIVFENRDVRVPALAAGTALLAIKADERIELGEVTIEAGDLLFEKPPVTVPISAAFGDRIALVGFDPPREPVRTSQGIPLTLFWNSLSSEIGEKYIVFVHLLGEDGQVIAQHDSPPANGQRPTDEWLLGQYIIDSHELVWREPGYSGPASIIVGLYDPATGARLLTAEGADHFPLPIAITVAPAE